MTKAEAAVVEQVIGQCDKWFDRATAIITSKGTAKAKTGALAFRDEVADVTRALKSIRQE